MGEFAEAYGVSRKTAYKWLGRYLEDAEAGLRARTAAEVTAAAAKVIGRTPGVFQTLTFDNGTEFHDYEMLERRFGVRCYFATPYHSWGKGLERKPERVATPAPTERHVSGARHSAPMQRARQAAQ